MMESAKGRELRKAATSLRSLVDKYSRLADISPGIETRHNLRNYAQRAVLEAALLDMKADAEDKIAQEIIDYENWERARAHHE